jgi:hypothetical protein
LTPRPRPPRTPPRARLSPIISSHPFVRQPFSIAQEGRRASPLTIP